MIRVVDYKSGFPPDPKRALQAPIYALCAQERLEARDRTSWTVTEASYVAFSGPRAQVTAAGGSRTDVDAFAAARDRLFAAVDGIGRGEFPPRPHDAMLCRSCAFVTVCRKDYVEDA